MKKLGVEQRINRLFAGFLLFFYGLLVLVAFLYLSQFKIVSNQREQQVINETIGRQSSILHNLMRELRQSGITLMTSPNIVRLKSSKLKNYDRIQAQRELASFVASGSFLKSAYILNFNDKFVYSSDEQYFSADFEDFRDKNVFDYLKLTPGGVANSEDRTGTKKPIWVFRDLSLDSSNVLSTMIQSDNNMCLVLNIDPSNLAKLFSTGDAISFLMQDDLEYFLLNAEAEKVNLELEKLVGSLERREIELRKNAGVLFSTRDYCIFSDKIENSNLYLCYMVPARTVNDEIRALGSRIMLIFALVMLVTIPSFVWAFRAIIKPFAKSLDFLAARNKSDGNLNLDDFVIDLTKRMAYLRLIENRGTAEDLRLVSANGANRLLIIENCESLPQSKLLSVFEFANFYILLCADSNLELVLSELSSVGRRIYLSGKLLSQEDFYRANLNLQELMLLDKFFSTASSSKIVDESEIERLKNTIEEDDFSLKTLLEMDYEHLLDEIDGLLDRWVNCLTKYRAIPLGLKLERELLLLEREMSEGANYKDLSDVSKVTLDEVKSEVKEKVLKYSKEKYEKKLSRALSLVEKVKKICREELANPNLSLKLVASKLDLNSEYLGRIFKDNMSMSVTSYINNMRLKEAEKLLLETELSHQEICKSIGMENSAYFYTLFKNEYKMTPGEYRKNNK